MEREKYNTLGWAEQATVDSLYIEWQEAGCTVEEFLNTAAWEEEWTGEEKDLRESLLSKKRLQS